MPTVVAALRGGAPLGARRRAGPPPGGRPADQGDRSRRGPLEPRARRRPREGEQPPPTGRRAGALRRAHEPGRDTRAAADGRGRDRSHQARGPPSRAGRGQGRAADAARLAQGARHRAPDVDGQAHRAGVRRRRRHLPLGAAAEEGRRGQAAVGVRRVRGHRRARQGAYARDRGHDARNLVAAAPEGLGAVDGDQSAAHRPGRDHRVGDAAERAGVYAAGSSGRGGQVREAGGRRGAARDRQGRRRPVPDRAGRDPHRGGGRPQPARRRVVAAGGHAPGRGRRGDGEEPRSWPPRPTSSRPTRVGSGPPGGPRPPT